MILDAASAIRAGSAGLFVLLGLFVLFVGRQRRGAVGLGLMLTFGGVATTANNLLRDGDLQPVKNALNVCSLLATIPALLWAPQRPQRPQWLALAIALGASGAAFAMIWAVGFEGVNVLYTLQGLSGAYLVAMRSAFVAAGMAIIAFPLAISWRAALDPPRSVQQWRARAALAAGASAAFVFQVPGVNLQPYSLWTLGAVIIIVTSLSIPWILSIRRGSGRIGVAMSLLWPALGAAFYLYQFAPDRSVVFFFDPWGVIGVLRLLGWILLVFAIARWDLLGVRLPHFAVNRGVVAASALALLFIVAQVAQNFFNAEFGLYTGGAVAGAFLFLASPVQRTFERLGSGSPPSPVSIAVPNGREEAFRKAVLLAYKDRSFTAAEELDLAELADHLGIGVRRAAEIRQQVEAKHARGA